MRTGQGGRPPDSGDRSDYLRGNCDDSLGRRRSGLVQSPVPFRGKIMTQIQFTKTPTPAWLLAFWKEIDDKTWGAGFDCFADDAVCHLGVADWHGKETIRANLRQFVDR